MRLGRFNEPLRQGRKLICCSSEPAASMRTTSLLTRANRHSSGIGTVPPAGGLCTQEKNNASAGNPSRTADVEQLMWDPFAGGSKTAPRQLRPLSDRSVSHSPLRSGPPTAVPQLATPLTEELAITRFLDRQPPHVLRSPLCIPPQRIQFNWLQQKPLWLPAPQHSSLSRRLQQTGGGRLRGQQQGRRPAG